MRASPLNELQSLSVVDTQLTLSGGGGTVELNPNIQTDQALFSTAVGINALVNNTGSFNTAMGTGALGSNSTGFSNTALGQGALSGNTTGAANTAVGKVALLNNLGGGGNTAVGNGALSGNTAGSSNTAVGNLALSFNTMGGSNTAVGNGALNSNITGQQNTATGQGALQNTTAGSSNTAIGFRAGWDAEGHNNIYINNPGGTESGTIRIGEQGVHARAFIAGISETDVGAEALGVVIDENGQLGVAATGGGGPVISPLRVALLRWYEANESGISFPVPSPPSALATQQFFCNFLLAGDSP